MCAARCENIAVPRVRISSYLQAERLLWCVNTTRCSVFWPVSNPEVWPAQTIKGMLTVIFALFFHYGSAAAGALITRVGLLRKWMGTDSTAGLKTRAPRVPMSWLLRLNIGREWLFLIFCLVYSHSLSSVCSLCPSSPASWLTLPVASGLLSCFSNYSSFSCAMITKETIIQNELTGSTFCNWTAPFQNSDYHRLKIIKLMFFFSLSKMDFSVWVLFSCKPCFNISYAAALTLVRSLSLTLALICVSCLVCCSWVQSGPLQASSASSGPSPPSLCSKYLWQPHTYFSTAQLIHSPASADDRKKALLTSNNKLDK